MLTFRNAKSNCKHTKFTDPYEYGYNSCQSCGMREAVANSGKTGAELLTTAEDEFGSFGAARAMFDLMNNTNGLQNYMLFDKEGKWKAYAVAAACYYQLRDVERKADASKMAFIWDWPFGYKVREAGYKAKAWKNCGKSDGWASKWFNWMANESPWKNCFDTKDWVQAFEEGVLYYTDVESEHLISVMSGVRYIGEFPHIPKAWVEACKHTPNKMLALLACHQFRVNEGGKAITMPHSSGHAMWSDNWFYPDMHVGNLLNGKLLPTGGSMSNRWEWTQCVKQFGWYDDRLPQRREVMNLPRTDGKWATDMFGAKYHEPGGMTVEAWMDEFTEEAYKWELKCR